MAKDKKSFSRITSNTDGFLSRLRWGESYTSLFLGAVVVVVVLILAFSFIRSKNLVRQDINTTSVTSEETQKLPNKYVVKDGENLWSIAEKVYGSGYNWKDIADANKLENPDLLSAGTELSLPHIASKSATVDKTVTADKPITGVSYKIVAGDNLWNISVRAYGDGFRWVEIARVNKLVNPNLIYPENQLRLPR
jgi:nucleoid-associated protein YgaU